ncbi:MAG: phosphoribosyl-ATP diphosphatase [Clostridia bacterium]
MKTRLVNDSVLIDLYKVIESRKIAPQEGSYTAYLFEKGLDKILKKCGEECAETIIAAKNGDSAEIVNEVADLIYHILVMLADRGIGIEEVLAELGVRSEKQKNLKTFKTTDKNT